MSILASRLRVQAPLLQGRERGQANPYPVFLHSTTEDRHITLDRHAVASEERHGAHGWPVLRTHHRVELREENRPVQLEECPQAVAPLL